MSENSLKFDEFKIGDIIYQEHIDGISVSRIKSDKIESEDGRFVLIDYDYINFKDMENGWLAPNFTNDEDAKILEWYITENENKYYRDILPALRDTISLLNGNLMIAKNVLIELEKKPSCLGE